MNTRSDTLVSDNPLARTASLQIMLLALALIIAPHMLRLPIWITLVSGALIAWRWLGLQRAWRLPGRGIKTLITVATAAGLFASYGTLIGRDAGVALLTLMLSLKLIEMRALRDVLVVVYLGLFLVVTSFLYSQTIIMAIYMLATVMLMITALLDLNRTDLVGGGESFVTRLRDNLRPAANLVLQAIPLMLVLFVLFPRISGPLWSLPSDAHSGRSGLSETMTPGSINQLILSDDIAFRVTFDGKLPHDAQRYWRGPVMWYTDGHTWRSHARGTRGNYTLPDSGLVHKQAPIDYTVTLEPHNKHWLFALDMPALAPEGARLSSDHHLLSIKPVDQYQRFRLRSYLEYNTGSLTARERRRGLQLPDHAHPQARQLAAQWRSEATSNAALVNRALSHFRNQEFIYTLLPPLLTGDPVDQFLFDTRKGFCEHYASSFVVLMRAANIPARVVTGYLGGQMNNVGNYFVVWQADAHAWAEVWLDGRGWVRVDPTAAIAPERIERSLDTSTRNAGAARFRGDNAFLADLWLQARNSWDALNTYWTQWVLDYSSLKQYDLLQAFGFLNPDWHTLAWLLMGMSALVLTLVALKLLWPRAANKDEPALVLYKKFCRKLARKGFVRDVNEGPEAFARRVTRERPDIEVVVKYISRLYIRLRYGAHPNTQLLHDLRRRVHTFAP